MLDQTAGTDPRERLLMRLGSHRRFCATCQGKHPGSTCQWEQGMLNALEICESVHAPQGFDGTRLKAPDTTFSITYVTPEGADRPTIVCLCGSTRFVNAFAEANTRETLAGHIVLTVGCIGVRGCQGHTDDEKRALDTLHLRKIDLADEILVLNVGGYVGESTGREVAYARRLGKRIRWLEDAAAVEAARGEES